jgi:hypothetical protein
LYHTTEMNRRNHDPLSDTPPCPDFNTCEARENLMFPFTLPGPVSLSKQQSWVLRMNPLVQASRDTTPCGGCGELEQCVEQQGGQQGVYECVCADGLERQGTECVDIDECALGTSDCQANAVCRNLFSYSTCECADGFEQVGTECVDIDECEQDPCDEKATCENTPGSFSCTCDPGYGGNGVTCLDVDECSNGTMNCAADADCINEPGSARCVCQVGFLGDGTSCTPYVAHPKTIASGNYDTCGIDASDQLVCWGQGVSPPAGTFTDIEANEHEFCALDTSGAITCWSSTSYSAVPSPHLTYSAVAVGNGFACGLPVGGQMHCWSNGSSWPNALSGTFVDLSAGQHHVCGLRADGTLSCSGQLNGALPSGRFNQIVSMRDVVCGLRTDGRIACSGGVMGGIDGASAETYARLRGPSSSFNPGLCALKDDNSAHCWDSGAWQTLNSTFVDLGVRQGSQGCGVTTSGTAECWGGGLYGTDIPPPGFP